MKHSRSSPQYLQVVLFGASMTWSWRARYGRRYADCIEEAFTRHLGVGRPTVVDVAACGAGGNTAREALPRLERDCLSYEPDVVVVSLGGNDAGRDTKPEFEAAYRGILEAVKQRTDALIVCETLPTVIDEWHAWKDRDFARMPGGLDAHIEAFSHTFVREIVAELGLVLHDRFRRYHDAEKADSELRDRLIRRDGIHLTEEGNAFFAETLAQAVVPRLPESLPRTSASAADWLARAAEDPVLHRMEVAGQHADVLRQALLDDETVIRLCLQRVCSFAHRSMVLAEGTPAAAEAGRIRALAAALLGVQRMLRPGTPEAGTGSRRWVVHYLSQLDVIPEGLRQLSATAQPG